MKRSIYITRLILTLVLIVFVGSCKPGEEQLDQKAQKIHEKIFTVDTHCDTPLRLLRSDYNPGIRNDPRKGGEK